jgi:hypothetical protein
MLLRGVRLRAAQRTDARVPREARTESREAGVPALHHTAGESKESLVAVLVVEAIRRVRAEVVAAVAIVATVDIGTGHTLTAVGVIAPAGGVIVVTPGYAVARIIRHGSGGRTRWGIASSRHSLGANAASPSGQS